MKNTLNQNTPLRKARLSLNMTTEEAAQYLRTTRKTWEVWEGKEAAGEPIPERVRELFTSKLEAMKDAWLGKRGPGERGELVVVFYRDPVSGADYPADVVSSENYLGTDPDQPGYRIIKSMAINRTGEIYVHRTRYEVAINKHVEAFRAKHTSVAE